MEQPSFWRDLAAQFRTLSDGRDDLRAIRVAPGEWHITGGPHGALERDRLRQLFQALAERAAIAADLTGDQPFVGWLEHLMQGPFFQPDTTIDPEDRGTGGGWLGSLCAASSDACVALETVSYQAERQESRRQRGSNSVGGGLALNLDRLRKECGWSLDDLAEQAAVDKSTVLDHIKHGKRAVPRTLKRYADALSRGLHQRITVEDLQR